MRLKAPSGGMGVDTEVERVEETDEDRVVETDELRVVDFVEETEEL